MGVITGKAALGFSFTYRYPNKVLSATADRMVAVGRLRGRNVCSFLGMEVSGRDIKGATLLKDRLESMPGTRDSTLPWEVRVARAKASAIGMARSEGMKENINTISYMAAHCAAGYGLVSMLLGDYGVVEVVIEKAGYCATVNHNTFGRCDTNVRFADETALAEAISAMERDSQVWPNAITLDASESIPKISVVRNAGKPASPAVLIAEGFAQKETLAYLWMAIEADMNMIVTGSVAGIRRLLQAASLFIQYHKRVFVVAGDNKAEWLGRGPNTMLCHSYDGGVSLGADRILIEDLDAKHTGAAFRSAMLGQPFIAGMQITTNRSITKILLARPYSIGEALLSKLDVHIHVPTPHGIEKITEYRWFGNGESEEQEGAAPGEPNPLLILSNKTFSTESLGASKAIYRYSKGHAILSSTSIEELKRRASFLASCSTPSIDSYWALRKLK